MAHVHDVNTSSATINALGNTAPAQKEFGDVTSQLKGHGGGVDLEKHTPEPIDRFGLKAPLRATGGLNRKRSFAGPSIPVVGGDQRAPTTPTVAEDTSKKHLRHHVSLKVRICTMVILKST